ncbi:ATPase family AAA domain-containing protein 3B [Hypsizygus marmoreus]|uniref:ATPase family AAA domain-containing protein 3B n=1 Tax=Hypsizygus marmoreus TaxID=39966 RepID=A0A369K111_HYPMA|nr:ATPase family AAA domain-containing protein 3B [Hypsizygus marmoreus]
MHRRFTSFVKNAPRAEDVDGGFDNESKVSTVVRENEPLPAPSLKVKRVDHYYSKWSKTWKYRNMNSKVTVEIIPILQSGVNDPWKDYSFVIVRKVPKQESQEPTFKIVVKSEYIVKACKEVVQNWPGISWNSDPLELDPEMFLTFFEEFKDYRDMLTGKKQKSEYESHVLASVNLLINSIASDYRTTLNTIDKFKAHSEITFDHLYAILVPRTIFVASCAVTGHPRLFKLVSFLRTSLDGRAVYQLYCESVDMIDSATRKSTIGKVQTTILLHHFKGTAKIQSLVAYPIKYHPEAGKLREALLRRGKKWVSLIGVHHKQFDGIGAFKLGDKLVKHNVNGRIMVDRATFRRRNPNYPFPVPTPAPFVSNGGNLPPPIAVYRPPSVESLPPQNNGLMGVGAPGFPPLPQPLPIYDYPVQGWSNPGQYANGTLVQTNKDDEESNEDISDEELMLASTVVYGYSLSDKTWLEFDVEQVNEVEWNEDAFANLVLPSPRKDLLRSLVEAHHRDLGFDDFIKGKGHGLVINLFGPPGVGKTFSAEATSEHVKRPLCVVGGGDLGTRASELDSALERIFDIATAWKAIVLIDEADVFLEQRSLHDLERNAMVAVFLRHVEYYRGILFLTTNRVQAFDEAFLSRIHVALHFHELSVASREQVWVAFIAKLGASDAVTPEQIKELAARDVNGRQIKNAARTAQSLAVGRGEQVAFRHFMETLDAMAEFNDEFRVLRKDYKQ